MAKIQHVIVLMMENRSFDHMLGFMDSGKPFEGLVGENRGRFREGGHEPGDNADYHLDGHPAHSHFAVMHQLTGASRPPFQMGAARQTGFVASFEKRGHGPDIMRCFAQGKVPVLTELAREYAVCDHWFSSVPGGTLPNRDFAFAGTSLGYGQNPYSRLKDPLLSRRAWRRYRKAHKRLGERNLFQQLQSQGKTARVYYHDVTGLLAWPQLSTSLRRSARKELYSEINKDPDNALLEDIRSDRLTSFSWVEPDYGIAGKGNSQHPGQAGGEKEFLAGEKLIGSIYQALLAKREVFEKTLFVIVYDEHGGFYDHVRPPARGDGTQEGRLAVQPDEFVMEGRHEYDRETPDYRFDFTVLGARVPAVLVSPLIPKNTVSSTVYDHTSILSTVRKLFMPDAPPFGERDRLANSFDDVISLETPRVDVPSLHDAIFDEAEATLVDDSPSGELSDLSQDMVALLLAAESDLAEDPAGDAELDVLAGGEEGEPLDTDAQDGEVTGSVAPEYTSLEVRAELASRMRRFLRPT